MGECSKNLFEHVNDVFSSKSWPTKFGCADVVDFFKSGCEFNVSLLYELIEIVIEFSIVDVFEKGYLIGWIWIGSHAG